MFQKKVTIKNSFISIKVSNEIGEVKFNIANDTSYHDAKKMMFETIKVIYKVNCTKDIEDYWEPKVKLIVDEIINRIYSIGLDKLDPKKNFAEYDLVKEK